MIIILVESIVTDSIFDSADGRVSADMNDFGSHINSLPQATYPDCLRCYSCILLGNKLL